MFNGMEYNMSESNAFADLLLVPGNASAAAKKGKKSAGAKKPTKKASGRTELVPIARKCNCWKCQSVSGYTPRNSYEYNVYQYQQQQQYSSYTPQNYSQYNNYQQQQQQSYQANLNSQTQGLNPATYQTNLDQRAVVNNIPTPNREAAPYPYFSNNNTPYNYNSSASTQLQNFPGRSYNNNNTNPNKKPSEITTGHQPSRALQTFVIGEGQTVSQKQPDPNICEELNPLFWDLDETMEKISSSLSNLNSKDPDQNAIVEECKLLLAESTQASLQSFVKESSWSSILGE